MRHQISQLYSETTERHAIPAFLPSYNNAKDARDTVIHSLSTRCESHGSPLPVPHLMLLPTSTHVPPQSTSSTSTTTAIFTASPPPPGEAGILVTKPALSAHTVLWVPSTIAASLRERTAILDSDRKHDAGVNPASEAVQSLRNNNTGLAFDVSVVVKAETRVEINGSSPRGADPSSCC